ncbi:MAG TPA: tRNA lysidine(34) synthetase TilS [Chitinophagaceae bacterium]|nr:tRNA lysidine(34) synthetase TilS [Chitinophagaceae bacterium]
MTLLEKFKEHIKNLDLFSAKDKLLLAVSGGVDSVVLCELCKRSEYDFVIAHCNFKLRGKESERDKKFVQEVVKKYNVEFFCKDFETEKYASDNKLSIQEAARKLRYDWFEELVNAQRSIVNKQPEGNSIHHSPFTIHLLTAHHADDNAETLLMNFFRGTGLHGLTGIPAKTGYIRRPLLPFSKAELVQFAKENKLDHVEDSSNQSSKYTRNFFRNELIPAISKVYPDVKENLQDNISRFKEIEKLYQHSVGEIKKKLCRYKGNEVHIPVKQLMGFNNRALTFDIICSYGFTEKQIDEVIKLAGSNSGKYITAPTGTHRIIRHRHWFIISPVAETGSENIIIENADKEIFFDGGKLQIEETSNLKPPTSNTIATLDLNQVLFPLLLRKWKPADYFYPLGMKKKKKKLARFFIDLKLSKTEKEKVWVIESNNRIAWVVGYRIDERFKITEKTKTVLKLQLQ